MEQEPRRRGRPRAFDAEAALERATRLFWQRGFSATSIADLGSELGLSPPSLYAAWHSKEALFCECLHRYSETSGARPLDRLRDAATLESGLNGFFRQLLRESAGKDEPRGCFLLTSVSEMTALPVEARRFIDRLRVEREADLERTVRAARARGELADGVPPRLYAALIASFALALNLKARAGTSQRALAREAKLHVAILLAIAGGRLPLR
jgi:TetR/AcrR family transcriptional regulator, copper-responsive repressor